MGVAVYSPGLISGEGAGGAYKRIGKSTSKQTIAVMIKIRFTFTCLFIKLQNVIISGASINTRGLIIGCIFCLQVD